MACFTVLTLGAPCSRMSYIWHVSVNSVPMKIWCDTRNLACAEKLLSIPQGIAAWKMWRKWQVTRVGQVRWLPWVAWRHRLLTLDCHNTAELLQMLKAMWVFDCDRRPVCDESDGQWIRQLVRSAVTNSSARRTSASRQAVKGPIW